MKAHRERDTNNIDFFFSIIWHEKDGRTFKTLTMDFSLKCGNNNKQGTYESNQK